VKHDPLSARRERRRRSPSLAAAKMVVCENFLDRDAPERFKRLTMMPSQDLTASSMGVLPHLYHDLQAIL
jgi:hypothetical protein